MLWKCCTQYVSKFGKLSSGHRTGKGRLFILIPKKVNVEECSNYCTIVLILHASQVMFKILQAMLHQYIYRELPDVQAGFRKGQRISNIYWIIGGIKEKRERENSRKIIYFCFINYTKAFDYLDHNTLWKILQVMGIPDHLICLLTNRYAIHETTIKTGHGTMDWFKIGKGQHQVCTS